MESEFNSTTHSLYEPLNSAIRYFLIFILERIAIKIGAVSIIGNMYLAWPDVGHNSSIPIDSKRGICGIKASITCSAFLQIKKTMPNGMIVAHTQTYIGKFKMGIFDKSVYQEAHTELAVEASGHFTLSDKELADEESVGDEYTYAPLAALPLNEIHPDCRPISVAIYCQGCSNPF